MTFIISLFISNILLGQPDTTSSDNFAKRKGKLIVPAYYFIAVENCCLNKYDKNLNPRNSVINQLNVTANSNLEVLSVFDGEIRAIMSINNTYTIVVSHGKYLSTYSGLSNLLVLESEKVTEKQTLGYVKSNFNNALLKFELWEGKEKLNPTDWIKMN